MQLQLEGVRVCLKGLAGWRVLLQGACRRVLQRLAWSSSRCRVVVLLRLSMVVVAVVLGLQLARASGEPLGFEQCS